MFNKECSIKYSKKYLCLIKIELNITNVLENQI